MSIYIYAGEDIFRLEEGVKKVLQDHRIDSEHTVTIDASDKRNFHIENVLVECDTFSLFDEDKKAVIVKNPFFLSANAKEAEKVLKTDSAIVKKRKENETKRRDERLQQMEQYLKQENPNTLLLFLCHGYNADTRKKDFKLLQTYHATIVNFKKMDEQEFERYVNQILKEKNYVLSPQANAEFMERISGDTMLFHAAIEKLDLYGQKQLDLDAIQHLVSLNSDVNIFHLTSSFTKGDLAGCMQAVGEMLTANYDYTVMISMLAKRLRSIYNMRLLHEDGYSNDEIGTRMHVKSGYVYYVLKDSSGISSKDVLNYLHQLAEIDQGIKAGTIDPANSFTNFLIKNGKRNHAGNQRTF